MKELWQIVVIDSGRNIIVYTEQRTHNRALSAIGTHLLDEYYAN
jgi:hypothetical protein